MDISIVSPVYQAEKIIDELVKNIIRSVSKLTDNFEIILVDDCSLDNSWAEIMKCCKTDKRVKGMKLSRNFGQQYAITAGLEASKGNFVVVMDCDLQDDPEYIPELYKKINEGYDLVFTRMKKKSHSLSKRLYSKLFSVLFSWLSDSDFYNYNTNGFSILSRRVVESFCKVNDVHRHYLFILKWLGYKHTYIEVSHKDRYTGESSYSFRKLCLHALNGIVSQSDKLLRLSISLGFVFSFISLFVLIVILAMYLFHGYKEGWASIVCIILLSAGLILISNGVIGIYIGKIFEQVKNRPLYLVNERINI